MSADYSPEAIAARMRPIPDDVADRVVALMTVEAPERAA